MGKDKKVEETKPEFKQPENKPVPQQKAAAVKLGCQASGCKANPERHEFCNEHFNQFKFGLITKMGLPVSDYEKKFEHYQNWLKARKVA